jgi:hypothetical protein
MHCRLARRVAAPGSCAGIKTLGSERANALTARWLACEVWTFMVTRTTVHRRWPDHAELITEALLEEARAVIPFPDSSAVRGDLRSRLRDIEGLIDFPSGGAGSARCSRTRRALRR